MDNKLLETLSQEAPNSLRDVREALELLSITIDSVIEQIGININTFYNNKDFEKIKELILYTQEVDNINEKIQNIIFETDNIIDEELIEIEENQCKENLNCSEFLVDNQIEHNLYEDLTHKKPYAFQIEDKIIEVRDWRSTLVKTVEYLAEKDKAKVIGFINDPKMNGKRIIYFTKEREKFMKAPRYIRNADMYIETSISPNGARNLLIKILNRFEIKLCEYKLYFKADYSQPL